ncbi:MAG TPA: c-type cytochrome, partial [Burkholderiales bacterium]|nr:c-type cytochrome [Burkholderiales bacterium]
PDEHTSFIKTPKQLLAVVILAFVIPVLLIATLASLATRGVTPAVDTASQEAIAKRLKPVGQVVVAEGSDLPGQRAAKQIVEAVCVACHATGALNAPKIGDTAAWQKLIAQGQSQLTQSAIKGVRQMPPRGGDPTLTDVEVARAVAFMANQSGAKFTEPPIQSAAPAQATAQSAAQKVASAAPAPSGSANGKSVYDASCGACHGAGVAGAPKLGDQAAWAPRLKQGAEALYQAALKGKGAMPPKGGNMSLADADVKAAVDFMAGQSK